MASLNDIVSSDASYPPKVYKMYGLTIKICIETGLQSSQTVLLCHYYNTNPYFPTEQLVLYYAYDNFFIMMYKQNNRNPSGNNNYINIKKN